MVLILILPIDGVNTNNSIVAHPSCHVYGPADHGPDDETFLFIVMKNWDSRYTLRSCHNPYRADGGVLRADHNLVYRTAMTPVRGN